VSNESRGEGKSLDGGSDVGGGGDPPPSLDPGLRSSASLHSSSFKTLGPHIIGELGDIVFPTAGLTPALLKMPLKGIVFTLVLVSLQLRHPTLLSILIPLSLAQRFAITHHDDGVG